MPIHFFAAEGHTGTSVLKIFWSYGFFPQLMLEPLGLTEDALKQAAPACFSKLTSR